MNRTLNEQRITTKCLFLYSFQVFAQLCDVKDISVYLSHLWQCSCISIHLQNLIFC